MKKILLLIGLMVQVMYAQEFYQLDPAFGNNGVVTFDFNVSETVVKDQAILSNGKVLVCGYYKLSFNGPITGFIVRFNSNGTIDNSFGTNGSVTFANSTTNSMNLFVFSDDSFLISMPYIGLMKFFSNGSLNTSFGTNGTFLGSYPYRHDVVIQEDDKFVVAYEVYVTPSSRDFKVQRYLSNGTLDSSFLSNNVNYGVPDYVNSAMIKLDFSGNIIVMQAVEWYWNGSETYRLFKLSSNGALDSNSYVTFLSQPAFFSALQNEGKIVVETFFNGNYSTKRYNPDLTIDSLFGINGTTVPYSYSMPYSAITSEDKKLTVSTNSYYYQGTPIDYLRLHRVDYNGYYDSSFGTSGIQILPAVLSEKHAKSLDLVSNSIYISGHGFTATGYYNNSIFVAKLNLNSSLSTNENNLENDFSFYPNPATHSIVFNKTVSSISVYSLDGKEVLVGLNKSELEVSSLAKGICFLKGITAEGKLFSEKLIKN